MLDIQTGNGTELCNGTTRRDFLRVGALSIMGLSLPSLLQMEAAQAADKVARKVKAKNVLLVFFGGGLTHHDTFDPKPDAPQEIRGKYGVIPTKLAGIKYSSMMPEMAKCNDLYALVRSQVVGNDHHETAAQWMLTGNYGSMQGGDFPSIGSIVTHETKPLNTLPPYVAIPKNHSFTWELGKAAWLGERYESFKSGNCGDSNWTVPNLSLLADVPTERLNRRQSMLKSIDTLAKKIEGADALASMDTFYQRAAQMLIASEARQAFDLSKEPEKVREAYGKDYWGKSGSACPSDD